MAITVKICGITTPEAADAAMRAGADLGGLVLHPRSPRRVSQDAAAQLAARMRGRLRLVVLLSDPKDEELEAALAAARPDFVQLHGGETPERVAAIRSRFGKPVVKAIAVADASDLARVVDYELVADMLLFDAKAPANAGREGGHGAPFDWQLLRGRTFTRPWLLAGGLTAGNVARAIRSAGAPGVDVSSGVEKAPGVKDCDMIAEFVKAARASAFETEAQP